MDKHTSEPWSQRDQYVRAPAKGKLTPHIAQICCGNTARPTEQELANARRIVACVNACAGIPTEALETGVISDAAAYIDDALHSLERLPNVEGAFRVTVIAELRKVLKLLPSPVRL